MTDIDKSPDRIAGMFDAIAGRYDLLNTVLSGGLDRYWRWRAIRSLRFSGREMLLDVCTGTADVAIAAVDAIGGAKKVVGVDFARTMLTHGAAKVRRRELAHQIRFAQGDAMHLPVRSESVDAVTIAFGIRNVQQPELACAELFRVLKPDGRVAILELGVPTIPGLRPLYLWYFRRILPRIGRAVSHHSAAYSYLPASVGAFPSGEAFAELLRGSGFDNVESRPLTFGTVYLYSAEKAGRQVGR